jgi:hypothetical protein
VEGIWKEKLMNDVQAVRKSTELIDELKLADEVVRVNQAWNTRLENEVQSEVARVEGIWKEKLMNDVQAVRKSMELDAQQLMDNMQEQHTNEMTKLATLIRVNEEALAPIKITTEQITSNLATSSRQTSTPETIKNGELQIHKMRQTVIALCLEVKKLRRENSKQQD